MENYNYGNAIYKSNQLIESCYNLTTAQNRLLYLAMSKLETRILDKNLNIKQVEDLILTSRFDLINIDVISYKKIFKLNSNSLYSELEKIATDLYESEIIYLDDKGDILRKRWVITCKYDKDKKGVLLQFHPDLIRDLLVMKSEYTRMIFDEFADKIKNKHAFRIYELCKQYLNLGYRDFYIDDLRFKLDLRDDEYSRYCDLKTKVINKAITEINKYTDLEIEYLELEKTKRTVSKIRLKIKKVKQKQISVFDEPQIKTEEENSIMRKMTSLLDREITSEQAKQILTLALTAIDTIPELKNTKLGVVDYISEKVKVCNNYIVNNKEKNINYMGILIRALERNWQMPTLAAEVEKPVKQLKFNNFEGRNYNHDAIEEIALGNAEYDPKKLYTI